MRAGRRLREPRRLHVLLVSVLLVPVLALGWLTLELLDKIQQLERQRVQQRLERAADEVLAASAAMGLEAGMQRIVSGETTDVPTWMTLVSVDRQGGATAPPGALAFVPDVPATPVGRIGPRRWRALRVPAQRTGQGRGVVPVPFGIDRSRRASRSPPGTCAHARADGPERCCARGAGRDGVARRCPHEWAAGRAHRPREERRTSRGRGPRRRRSRSGPVTAIRARGRRLAADA